MFSLLHVCLLRAVIKINQSVDGVTQYITPMNVGRFRRPVSSATTRVIFSFFHNTIRKFIDSDYLLHSPIAVVLCSSCGEKRRCVS